jgi:hypothetical protein
MPHPSPANRTHGRDHSPLALTDDQLDQIT